MQKYFGLKSESESYPEQGDIFGSDCDCNYQNKIGGENFASKLSLKLNRITWDINLTEPLVENGY